MSHAGDFDVIISGAGPAGLAAAALCARAGMKTALITGPDDPFARRHDPRTIALMRPSVRLLEHLGVFGEELRALSNPLRKLRLVDDTGGLFSAPEAIFDARDAGWEAFGWNIPLQDLHPALAEEAREAGARFIRASALGVGRERRELARVRLDEGGEIAAPLVIAADGRASKIRETAGFHLLRHDYDQVALGCFFSHSGPHGDMSTEYHKDQGPFTTVPMPGRRSSLVWMMRPGRAAKIMELSEDELARRIQMESHGELGRISEVTRPGRFPMQTMNAVEYARGRVILCGEAAHAVPPIGAQGLNMSLRDAALAAELAGDAFAFGDDPGAAEIMDRYDRVRRRDIFPRKAAIHLVNSALLSNFAPLQALRAGGIALAASLPFVRDIVMRQGLAPAEAHLPRVMCEDDPGEASEAAGRRGAPEDQPSGA